MEIQEFEIPTDKVYVKTDAQGRITEVSSSFGLTDYRDGVLHDEGWTLVDEGHGDRYKHAGSHYFDGGLQTQEGVYLYKLVDGVAVERTAAEIQADIDAIPARPPEPLDDAMAMAVDHEYRLTLLELGVN